MLSNMNKEVALKAALYARELVDRVNGVKGNFKKPRSKLESH